MRMFSLLIGAIIGATVATNYDLRPLYDEKIRPHVEAAQDALISNKGKRNKE